MNADMDKKKVETDVLIIGAGLCGLTLAYLLRNEGWRVDLVEGRDRIGGRIYTEEMKGGSPTR